MLQHIITQRHLQKAMSYSEYKNLVDKLLTEGKSTGHVQNDELLEYTKLNVHRMQRNEKTVHLLPELVVLLQELPTPVYWLVLTEGWCGDSAQILPVIAMMADASPNIDLRILLRDDNADVMDAYLTNGSRSVPKLICLHQDTLEEIFTWGPRPALARDLVLEHKNNPHLPAGEFKKQLHLWYAKDRGVAIQNEFIALLKKLQESSNKENPYIGSQKNASAEV